MTRPRHRPVRTRATGRHRKIRARMGSAAIRRLPVLAALLPARITLAAARTAHLARRVLTPATRPPRPARQVALEARAREDARAMGLDIRGGAR